MFYRYAALGLIGFVMLAATPCEWVEASGFKHRDKSSTQASHLAEDDRPPISITTEFVSHTYSANDTDNKRQEHALSQALMDNPGVAECSINGNLRMPNEGEEAPKLRDWVRAHIYRRFGILGLVAPAAIAVMFFVWTQWKLVKEWPGVSKLVVHVERDALPLADPSRFSVAVANLEGDDQSNEHKALLVRLLMDFPGIQVLSFDRTISVRGSVPEDQARLGHLAAREYLEQSGASVLIWGSILRYGAEARPDLYLTQAGGRTGSPHQYSIGTKPQFHLPNVFWEDLFSILSLVIASQDAQFRNERGRYIADRLDPFVSRVKRLLESNDKRTEWDVRSLSSARFALGRALEIIGAQTGDNSYIREAIHFYREALTGFLSDANALDWASVQHGLGNAYSYLAQHERNTAWFDLAMASYTEALTKRNRTKMPQDWANTQVNIGVLYLLLGEGDSNTNRLEKAAEYSAQRSQSWTVSAHRKIGPREG